MDYQEINGRTLAYLGDAVWSYKVRLMLVENGLTNGAKLQRETISYVSAKAQAALYERLEEENFWKEKEKEVYLRGRNDHSGKPPHNTSVQTYRKSTGFEAIIGYLQLTNQEERIDMILQKSDTNKGE